MAKGREGFFLFVCFLALPQSWWSSTGDILRKKCEKKKEAVNSIMSLGFPRLEESTFVYIFGQGLFHNIPCPNLLTLNWQ